MTFSIDFNPALLTPQVWWHSDYFCHIYGAFQTFRENPKNLESVINGAKIISNTEAGSLHVLVSTEQQTKMPMSCQNEFSEFKTENSEHENKQEILNIGIVKLEVAEANRGQLRIRLIV